jgi:hypothetical protein
MVLPKEQLNFGGRPEGPQVYIYLRIMHIFTPTSLSILSTPIFSHPRGPPVFPLPQSEGSLRKLIEPVHRDITLGHAY